MTHTNNNNGKRPYVSNCNNEGNNAKSGRVEDQPPNTTAKHDDNQRKHRMSVENNLKAALRNESYATDEFLRNLSLEVTTCFTALTTKVYLVSNHVNYVMVREEGQGKEEKIRHNVKRLGTYSRKIDVMVNLFLSKVDNGVTGVLELMSRKQISDQFKDYNLNNKWLNFKSLLGNVEEEIGGASLYGRNVVNYATIKKYMLFYREILNSFVLGTMVLSGEKWVPVGFHQQGDTNVPKTSQVILPLHSSLVFHNVIHYKDTISNYYNIHFEFNDDRVTLSPCKLGTGKIRLAPFTDTNGIIYLVKEWLIRKVVDPCKNLGANVVRSLEPACIQFISQVLCTSMIEVDVNDSSFDCSIDNVCKVILPKVLKANDNGCFGYDHVMETIEDLVLTERKFLAGAMIPKWSDKNFAHVNFEDTPEQLVTGILELSGLDDNHDNETCVTRFLQYNVNSQQEVHQQIFMEHIPYVFREIFIIDPEVVERYTWVEELIPYSYLPEMGTIFTPLTEKLAGYLLEKSDDLLSANILVEFLDDNVVNNYGKGTGELNPAFKHLQGCDFVFHKLWDFETWDCFKTSKDQSQNNINLPHIGTKEEGGGSTDTGESSTEKAKLSQPSGINKPKRNSDNAGNGDNKNSQNGDRAKVSNVSSTDKSSERNEQDDINESEEEVPHWAIPLIRCQVTLTKFPLRTEGTPYSYVCARCNLNVLLKEKDPEIMYPIYEINEQVSHADAYKRKVLKPRYLLDSAEYCARSNELNDGDENDERNPFLYHFETGFDALCAQNGNLVLTILNGCNKIDGVRERLNSPKGHFDEEEALEIWEQCLKYVTEDIFPFYEEGDTGGVDHVWALGVIMPYVLWGYPALKGTEDIKCYNNVGIGRPVQSREGERHKLNGHTFPRKQWCNLTPEARKRIKECIHFHPGNRPCLTSLWFNKWRTTTEEAIIEKNGENKIKDNWNSFMNKATKQSKRKKQKLKQSANKDKRDKEDGNKRNIVHWLQIYEKHWKSPEDLEEYKNYPVPCGAWRGRAKITRLQEKKIAGMANAARDGDTRDNTKNTSITTMSIEKNTTIAATQEGTTAAERETPLKRKAENISMMDSSDSESDSDSDSDSSLVSEDNNGSSTKNMDNSEKMKETGKKKTTEGRQQKKKNVNRMVKRLTELANKNPDLIENILKMVSDTSKKGENYKEDAAKTTGPVPLKTVRSSDSIDKVSTLSYGTIHSMKTGTMKLLKTHKDTIEGQVRAYVKKEWYGTIIKHWQELIGLVSDGVMVQSSENSAALDVLPYVPTTDVQLTRPYYDIILPFVVITAADSEMAKVPASFPGTVALNTDSVEILANEYRRYGDADNEEFYYFVTRILSAVNLGKTNFKLRKTEDLIITIFTVANEAFALMIIDNEYSNWEYYFPSESDLLRV
eukprot:jgi/Psemu1/10390/gm1.10390_g